MKEVDRNMQARNLAALAKSSAGFKFAQCGFFPYTSGEIGPYYVQSAGIMEDGKAYSQACDDMTTLVKKVIPNLDNIIIAGGETRDWMFSGPVATRLNLPHTMIYNDGKVIGAKMNGRDIAFVADLNNEGSSPRDKWVPTAIKEGGNPKYIFFFIDRLEDGVKVMEKLNLESNALIPLDMEAWDYLQEEKIVTKSQHIALCERMENKYEWAKLMLQSEDGLDCLASLIASKKTKEKGEKILFQGYPKLKDTLIKQLTDKFGRGVVRNLYIYGL